VPDWIPPVRATGTKVKVIHTDEFFPHMAQGIAASDDIIKQKPEMIRAFVKAALRGMKDIMDSPDQAADDFVRFVPEWKGKEGAVKFALNMYSTLVRDRRSWARSRPSGSPSCRSSTSPRASSRSRHRSTSSTATRSSNESHYS
jgi:hypothetical protein